MKTNEGSQLVYIEIGLVHVVVDCAYHALQQLLVDGGDAQSFQVLIRLAAENFVSRLSPLHP